MSQTTAVASLDLRTVGLSHTTLPVRDPYTAARFYIVAFNAEIGHVGRRFVQGAPDRLRPRLGSPPHHGTGLIVSPGIEVDLFPQDYGQPTLEQAHPHHAFEIRAEDLQRWLDHFTYWQIPFEGPSTREAGSVSIYFNDLDGNHLELHCVSYPEELRKQLPGTHAGMGAALEHWPPAGREAEADRVLEATIEAWLAKGGGH